MNALKRKRHQRRGQRDGVLRRSQPAMTGFEDEGRRPPSKEWSSSKGWKWSSVYSQQRNRDLSPAVTRN